MLKNQEGTRAIMDDIIIYGKTTEEHDERLKRTLETIRESGLKLNKSKCETGKGELSYFGHIIGEKGISPDPTKIQAIRDMAAPKGVPELRQFLGMINYLGRFLPNLPTTLSPISELLESYTAWTWDSKQQEAFEKVK